MNSRDKDHLRQMVYVLGDVKMGRRSLVAIQARLEEILLHYERALAEKQMERPYMIPVGEPD